MTKKPTSRSSPAPRSKPHLPGRAKTPRREDGKFVKGVKPSPGRARGTRNRTTVLLKDAILTAATLVGQDGKGKDGLVGYLKLLAVKDRAVYARLLEKVLPMQVHVDDKTVARYTPAEAVARLRERGLPVPTSLLSLAGPMTVPAVAHALNDQHQDGVTDYFDNRARMIRDIAVDYEAELEGREDVQGEDDEDSDD